MIEAEAGPDFASAATPHPSDPASSVGDGSDGTTTIPPPDSPRRAGRLGAPGMPGVDAVPSLCSALLGTYFLLLDGPPSHPVRQRFAPWHADGGVRVAACAGACGCVWVCADCPMRSMEEGVGAGEGEHPPASGCLDCPRMCTIRAVVPQPSLPTEDDGRDGGGGGPDRLEAYGAGAAAWRAAAADTVVPLRVRRADQDVSSVFPAEKCWTLFRGCQHLLSAFAIANAAARERRSVKSCFVLDSGGSDCKTHAFMNKSHLLRCFFLTFWIRTVSHTHLPNPRVL